MFVWVSMCKSRDRGSYFYIVNDLVIEYKVENKSSHPTTATTSCLSQRLSVSHSSQSLDFVAGSSSRVKSSGLAGYGTSPMYLCMYFVCRCHRAHHGYIHMDPDDEDKIGR